jgi:hypothetical protein
VLAILLLAENPRTAVSPIAMDFPEDQPILLNRWYHLIGIGAIYAIIEWAPSGLKDVLDDAVEIGCDYGASRNQEDVTKGSTREIDVAQSVVRELLLDRQLKVSFA